jgi:Family of unknown function (DUF5953)
MWLALAATCAAVAGLLRFKSGNDTRGRMKHENLSHQIYLMVPVRATDAADRLEAALRAIETRYPSSPINHLRHDDREEVVHGASRRDRLSQLFRESPWEFSLSNGLAHVGSGAAWRDEGMISLVPGYYLQEGIAALALLVPVGDWGLTAALVADVGDALDAHWAYVTPSYAFDVIRNAQWSANMPVDAGELAAAKSALPKLRDRPIIDTREPRQPEVLGWINYWRADTVAFLQPNRNAKRLHELFAKVVVTPGGATMAWVTEQPLDLGRSAHVKALAEVYRGLPRLGLRL